MNEIEEITRGNEAERLLNDPMLVECFTKVESGLIDALKRCPMADRDTQHEIALSLQLLSKVQSNLKEVAQTGRLALHQKQERENWLKRQLRKVA
jgi:hypothetical protein